MENLIGSNICWLCLCCIANVFECAKCDGVGSTWNGDPFCSSWPCKYCFGAGRYSKCEKGCQLNGSEGCFKHL